MSDINIPIEPSKPLTVTLGEKSYTVRPIKTTLGIAMAQRFQNVGKDLDKLNSGVDSVITTIFGKTDALKIKKRLEDPADDLDIPHIVDLMKALVERSTGNPTT